MIRVLLALVLLAPLSAFGWAFTNDGGGTWTYRVSVTVLASAVDQDLTNYPVYINAADLPAGFHSYVASGACDVRVSASDGVTELPVEIVSYDAAGDTGEFYFLAPTLTAAADSVFYVYAGNASATCHAATDTYGAQAVWPDYHYVAHDGGDTDSSGNSTPAVLGNVTPNIGAATGIVGEATRYGGGGFEKQGITIPDPPVHINGFYVSAFINYTDITGNEVMYLWQHGDSADAGEFYYRPYESQQNNASYPRLRVVIINYDDFAAEADDFVTTRFPSTGVWQHITTYGDVGGDRGAHLNGAPLGTPTPFPAGFDPVGPFVLAAGAYRQSIGGYIDNRDTAGIYDEVRMRLSTPANVDAWAAFEYDNISDPTATYSVGVQETVTGEPIADFSADVTSGSPALTVQFTDESVDSGSTITAWSWDVDNDGTPDYTTQNPSHTYTAEGVYTVSLTVTNANGSNTFTRTDYIEVADKWWAQCGDPNDLYAVYDPWAVGEAGGTLAESYQDLSPAGNDASVPSDSSAPTLGANGWVFAGAEALNTGALLNPDTSTILAYGEATADVIGSFLGVRGVENTDSRWGLQPTDGNGNRLYTYGPSGAARIPGSFVNTPVSMGLAGGQPYLNGAADGPALSGMANFGDQPLYVGGFLWATSTNTVIRRLTGNVRRVVISKSVLSAGQMAACHAAMITDPGVAPALPPVAQFSATPLVGEAPLAVQFTDSSTNTPTAWSWDVDNDGQEDYTTQNPQHTYSNPGTYTVSLTVTNADGNDTETKTDYIRATPPPVPEVIPTTVTRSVRPGATPVNADGFFDSYQPLD